MRLARSGVARPARAGRGRRARARAGRAPPRSDQRGPPAAAGRVCPRLRSRRRRPTTISRSWSGAVRGDQRRAPSAPVAGSRRRVERAVEGVAAQPAASASSSTRNSGSIPAATAFARSRRAQNPWIVDTHAPSASRAPPLAELEEALRAALASSAAALSVNVIARMRVDGSTRSSSTAARTARRCTAVLPLPALAYSRRDPSRARIASDCSSVKARPRGPARRPVAASSPQRQLGHLSQRHTSGYWQAFSQPHDRGPASSAPATGAAPPPPRAPPRRPARRRDPRARDGRSSRRRRPASTSSRTAPRALLLARRRLVEARQRARPPAPRARRACRARPEGDRPAPTSPPGRPASPCSRMTAARPSPSRSTRSIRPRTDRPSSSSAGRSSSAPPNSSSRCWGAKRSAARPPGAGSAAGRPGGGAGRCGSRAGSTDRRRSAIAPISSSRISRACGRLVSSSWAEPRSSRSRARVRSSSS